MILVLTVYGVSISAYADIRIELPKFSDCTVGVCYGQLKIPPF